MDRFITRSEQPLDDIDRFRDVQLTDFKKSFPIHSGHKVYGGIGALVVRDDSRRRAGKKGLFALTQGRNDCAHPHNPKRPRVI